MKILTRDIKHGKVAVQAQSLDDLWYLSQVVAGHDKVVGKTTRKVKLGSSEEAVKKTYTLSLAVDKVEFKEQALRISGTTTEPYEDIPNGAHHTITIEPGDTLTIIKQQWHKYNLDRLNKAAQEQLKALIVVFDRETCVLARLKSTGYEVIAELKGKVKKKGYDTATVTNFYKEIITAMSEYDERHKPDKIILASPAFWKEELANEMKSNPAAEAIKGKLALATCSSVGENAIDEVLKRPEMATVLENAETAKDIRLVEEVMTAIAKDGKVAYGKKEVEEAIAAGAVERLLINDALIYSSPAAAESMKKTEESGGAVAIINSENTAGQKLAALGGTAALLRYRLR